MSGSGSSGDLSGGGGGGGPGADDTLDFLFGADGPFRLPATSEEFFGTAGRPQQREVGLTLVCGLV
jgi:hypothetical protein